MGKGSFPAPEWPFALCQRMTGERLEDEDMAGLIQNADADLQGTEAGKEQCGGKGGHSSHIGSPREKKR